MESGRFTGFFQNARIGKPGILRGFLGLIPGTGLQGDGMPEGLFLGNTGGYTGGGVAVTELTCCDLPAGKHY
jgi:hypothetical protein